MKKILFYLLLASVGMSEAAAQTNKKAKDDDEVRPLLPSEVAKSMAKSTKTGGQASAVTDVTETVKAVKAILNNTEKKNEGKDIIDPDDTKKLATTDVPTMTPTTRPTIKDVNTIEYHETFRPEVLDTKSDYVADSIYVNPEVPATFLGGPSAMKKFIEENLHIPLLPEQGKVKGRIFISFIVNKEGQLEQVRMVKGLRDEYNNEALKMVKKMPRWQPAKHQGKLVRSAYTLPIAIVVL